MLNKEEIMYIYSGVRKYTATVPGGEVIFSIEAGVKNLAKSHLDALMELGKLKKIIGDIAEQIPQITEAAKLLLKHGSLHNPNNIKVVPSSDESVEIESELTCLDCGRRIHEETLAGYPGTALCWFCIEEK